MTRPLHHRLLLVQHRDDLHRQLREALEALGVIVLSIDDSTEALRCFREDDIDIVMIDIDLPDCQGITLLDDMAADPRELPLICVSRRESLADVLSAVRHGATDYLMLPPESADVIRHAINRAVERCELKRENLAYRHKLEAANRELLESLTHLQQDQQAGKHVQQLLLPDTPKDIEGYQFCHFILPSLYLSGDFVDYFLVGDDRAVFFVADVSGHGASSAFVTVFLKNLFARKRSDYLHRGSTAILSPAKMLAIANRELLEMGIGKHVTMCVGVFDLNCDQLCYAVAGHLPAPVLACDGQAEFLPEHDMPVGLFSDAAFTDHMICFPSGAVLTLFSDGILEVLQRDSLKEKEEALLALLSAGQRSSSELVTAFDLNNIGDAPDDIAILVISRLQEVMQPGKILVAEQDGAFVIKLVGEVRLTLCTTMDDFFDDMLTSKGFASVVIDLVDATNIDSTTLGLLAKLAIKAKQRFSYVPVILSTNPDITRVLDSMGFGRVFCIRQEPVVDDEDLNELPVLPDSEDAVRAKVLEAHRVLMGMNESNRAKFRELVTLLEGQCY